MACLRDILGLFGQRHNPFYAGFGNRFTDALSYRSVNIPSTRIFTINSYAEVSLDLLTLTTYKSSYVNMRDLVDHYFPPVALLSQDEQYTDFNYWREPLPDPDDFSDSDEEDEEDEDEEEGDMGESYYEDEHGMGESYYTENAEDGDGEEEYDDDGEDAEEGEEGEVDELDGDIDGLQESKLAESVAEGQDTVEEARGRESPVVGTLDLAMGFEQGLHHAVGSAEIEIGVVVGEVVKEIQLLTARKQYDTEEGENQEEGEEMVEEISV